MAYTRYGPFVNNSATKAITAGFLNTLEDEIIALDAGYNATGAPRALTGSGIDPTGTTDSTTGVQTFLDACPDGTAVSIPSGVRISVSGTITINHRITLSGPGTLTWTGGIGGAPALTVNADGSAIDQLRMFNQTNAANQTGNKQYGIWITANYVRVTHCWVQQFQQSIAVSPYGEYHSYLIALNHVIDVIGSGDGPSNSTSSNGEDRGDGIVSWGAAGVIMGNRVTAQAGTDARIGIHVEGLGGLAGTPYAHADSMNTITGNTITGKFRRGIVSEGVASTTIGNNTISDVTWWGVAVIGTSGCVVADNTIYWTRTASDNQGSSWNPRRSGLMMYASGASNLFTGNQIFVNAGAQLPFGISAQSDGTGPIDYLTIQDNQVIDTNGNTGSGIYLDGSVNLIRSARVKNNELVGFLTYAQYLYACSDIETVGNYMVSGVNTATGIRLEASATSARVDQNTIFKTGTAIQCFGRSAVTTVNNNTIATATTGIDLSGTAGATVSLNRFDTVTTKTANVPSGAVTIGNN